MIPLAQNYYTVCPICGTEDGTDRAIYGKGKALHQICAECNKFFDCNVCDDNVVAHEYIQHLINHGWPHAIAEKMAANRRDNDY